MRKHRWYSRRWAVVRCLRWEIPARRWREVGRFWRYASAAKVMGAQVVDPLLGSGVVFRLVDLRDDFTMVETAQVGTHDKLDPFYGGPRHQTRDEPTAEEVRLVAAGYRTEAIKQYRNRTGCTLRVARQMIASGEWEAPDV